jgi:hypothetical protein
MARRLPLLLGMIFLFACPTHAQWLGDKVEVFGGYAYMRFHNAPSTNLNGWELSGQYKWNKWIGLEGDFGGEYGRWGGIGISVHTFLFGPEVSWPARVSPFAHLLLGAAHRGGSGLTDTSFSYAAGAGIDTRLVHGVYWRAVQADYLPTLFFGGRQANVRFSTGIVFRF